ncbi:MAG: NAD(+)/NADH kinase [Planctomycetota bacterium]
MINPAKADDAADAGSLAQLIADHGTLIDSIETNGDADEETPGVAEDADLIVVVGGDGTLLAQSRRFAPLGVPILGINAGKLGFLADFTIEDVRQEAPSLFGDAPLVTRRVPMLDATIIADDGTANHVGSALNEAAVTAGPPYRVIELGISIDGESGPSVRGDGLIVSTSLGSTAYNVSAGGPICHPRVDATLITPIAAHSLAFRPIAVPGDAAIELTPTQLNTQGDDGTTLVLDGQIQQRILEGQRVRIERATRGIELVTNTNGSYWRTLIDKLHWAKPPALRDR